MNKLVCDKVCPESEDVSTIVLWRVILKSEIYYLKKFTPQEELTEAIENYIYFYNTKRFQLKLRCMTPMEFHYAKAA